MEAKDLERRLAELRTRLARLSPPCQEQALDAFADVLTVLELPRDKDGPVNILVTLEHESNIEYPSG
ncbi:MAG TPA: hypothetical protein VH743_20420 [Beijerinckiaceae bacterium]|jgi:hypothetical protein